MSSITADPKMLAALSQAKGATEIRDANGRLVGIFTPKGNSDEAIRKLFDLKKARERLEREGHKARPFREIITKLKKMERAGAGNPKKRPRKTA